MFVFPAYFPCTFTYNLQLKDINYNAEHDISFMTNRSLLAKWVTLLQRFKEKFVLGDCVSMDMIETQVDYKEDFLFN